MSAMTAMIVKQSAEVASEVPKMDGVKGATMRLLLGDPDGMPNFFMREFTVEPGGHTPLHRHDYEHEVYVLGGEGEIECAGRVEKLAAGQAIYVPANELHQFRATAANSLRFLCLVPAASFRK